MLKRRQNLTKTFNLLMYAQPFQNVPHSSGIAAEHVLTQVFLQLFEYRDSLKAGTAYEDSLLRCP